MENSSEESNETSEESNETSEESNDKSEEFFRLSGEKKKFPWKNFHYSQHSFKLYLM